ncbi:MAG: sugar ABC transporter substrate-binding protein [candidate division FCPU426 bacterium]
MKKLSFLCLALLLGLACMTACRSRQGKPHTLRLRYWGDLEEMGIISSMLADFKKAHPGSMVSAERKPADNTYKDILLTEFAAGLAPDVIFVDAEGMDQLLGEDKLLDLTPFLEKEKDLKIADYYPAIVKRFSKDGKLFVLPRDISPIAVIYYNKSLFDKAGLSYPKDDWDWEALRKDARLLTHRSADGKASQLGFADDRTTAEGWILSSGGSMVDDPIHPTRISADSPEALRGIQFRWDLLQKDRSMASQADTRAFLVGGDSLFSNGMLAMYHSGIWKTPAFRKIKAFDWDVAMFPKGPGGRRAFSSGGSGYAIRKDCADPELAWALIKSLAGPEGQKRLAMTGLAQPALMPLAASPYFLDGQKPLNKKMLLEAAKIGVLPPAWDDWPEFLYGTWLPAMDAVWVSGYHGDLKALVHSTVEKGNKKFFRR